MKNPQTPEESSLLLEISLPPEVLNLPVWGWRRDAPFVKESDRDHWIYFLQGDDGGPIKIGRTYRDPRWRCAAVQAGYPFGALRVVGLIRGHARQERVLHVRFRRLRLLGEWFAPELEILDFVRGLPLPSFEGCK